jgi:hypothetical protein
MYISPNKTQQIDEAADHRTPSTPRGHRSARGHQRRRVARRDHIDRWGACFLVVVFGVPQEARIRPEHVAAPSQRYQSITDRKNE